MITEFDFEQPLELVSVSVYAVVTMGDAVGFDNVDVKPDGTLVHE